jgi:hypothetical protein
VLRVILIISLIFSLFLIPFIGKLYADSGASGVIGCEPEVRKLTEPMTVDMPPKKSIGKKIGGALIGGLTGFGGMSGAQSEDQEDNLVSKPKGDWTTLTGPDGKTKIKLLAYAQNNSTDLGIGMQVKKSKGKGTPHMVLLQHEDGRILEPEQISIFSLWGSFSLEVTTWRETYVDGQMVSRKHMGTEVSNWSEMLGTYETVVEGPSIWQRLGTKPFKGNRGIIVDYKIPPGFNPEEWSIIAHVTGKVKDPETKITSIKTVPFVADLSGPALEVINETGTTAGKKKGKKDSNVNIEVVEASETRFHRGHDCSLSSSAHAQRPGISNKSTDLSVSLPEVHTAVIETGNVTEKLKLKSSQTKPVVTTIEENSRAFITMDPTVKYHK